MNEHEKQLEHINAICGELNKEPLNTICYEYSLHPTFKEMMDEEVPFTANRYCLMYKFLNGYAIYQIVGYKQYELKEIIGEVPEELLKDLDHDANHRAWVSRTYNTKTPILLYDK